MQITKADVIKNGEQDLIDAITADLDWGAIENIFREQHNLSMDEDVEYKQGDIIVHNNQIAYQLQFEVRVTVSVLLDRQGNYLSVAFSGNNENDRSDNDEQGTVEKPVVPPEAGVDLGVENRQNQAEEIQPEIKTSAMDPDSGEKEAEDRVDEIIVSEVEAEQEERVESDQGDPDGTGVESGFIEDDEDSGEKISQIASQVGEMMKELEEETSL